MSGSELSEIAIESFPEVMSSDEIIISAHSGNGVVCIRPTRITATVYESVEPMEGIKGLIVIDPTVVEVSAPTMSFEERNTVRESFLHMLAEQGGDGKLTFEIDKISRLDLTDDRLYFVRGWVSYAGIKRRGSMSLVREKNKVRKALKGKIVIEKNNYGIPIFSALLSAFYPADQIVIEIELKTQSSRLFN